MCLVKTSKDQKSYGKKARVGKKIVNHHVRNGLFEIEFEVVCGIPQPKVNVLAFTSLKHWLTKYTICLMKYAFSNFCVSCLNTTLFFSYKVSIFISLLMCTKVMIMVKSVKT